VGSLFLSLSGPALSVDQYIQQKQTIVKEKKKLTDEHGRQCLLSSLSFPLLPLSLWLWLWALLSFGARLFGLASAASSDSDDSSENRTPRDHENPF
jgi:hypothetical protein